MIAMTLKRLGTERMRELTNVLMPSFLLATLRGLRALSDLKALIIEMFSICSESKNTGSTQITMVHATIRKSSLFQLHFRYAYGPITNPMTITLKTHSATNIPEIIFNISLRLSIWY